MWLLAALIIFAPLIRGGRPALPSLVLELTALVVLALVLWAPKKLPLRRLEWFFLAFLFFLPLIYLIPVSTSLFEFLPGRDLYQKTLALLDSDLSHTNTRLSVYPLESESAWLMVLVPIAAFLGARTLDAGRALKLTLVLVAIAAVEATLGIMQYGNGARSPLYLGMSDVSFGSAVGTYANRNHLAGLLEMVLPIALALMFYSMGRDPDRVSRRWRERAVFLSTLRGHTAFFYGAVALLLLLGIVFSRSRAGIALSMLAILLTSIAFSRRIGGDNVYGVTGTLLTFAIGIGMVIGLAPVLERFSTTEAVEAGRWNLFSATLDGIGAFFPLGSGPGNYPDVFPAFQPLAFGRWFVNHAHNDYLEWIFEAGLLAALLILLFFVLYAYQWTRIPFNDNWSRFRFVQIGAGIGIFLMMLHTFVDYNLHIPANLIYFAFLIGIFFADPDPGEENAQRHRRGRRTRKLGESNHPDSAPAVFTPAEPPPDQIPNPFLD